MIHITLPAGTEPRRLPFYLSMEEWVAKNLKADDYFFTWIVPPTVICGRNQMMDAEINMQYCAAEGIDMCRRKSGGGAVYADFDNVMISLITSDTESVEATFARFAKMLASALCALGISAESSGRNDVLIGGRKVSGGAFLHLPERSIAHSTMLFSTNMQHMLRAITPAKAKLESKQVKSVESRITTVAEHSPGLTIERLRAHIIDFCSESSIALTPQQVKEIERTEMATYGRVSRYQAHGGEVYDFKAPGKDSRHRASAYVPGAGAVSATVTLRPDGTIANATLGCDLLNAGDLSRIEVCLQGVPCTPEHIQAVLANIDLGSILPGVPAATLTRILTSDDANSGSQP